MSRMLYCCIALLAGSSASARETEQRIAIDGSVRQPVHIDDLKTPTGLWPVYDLGSLGSDRAYLFELIARPSWYSICIVRQPTSDGIIDDKPYQVQVGAARMTISALPGSMKCADSGEPVAPTPERLASAVRQGRILPYSRTAFDGFRPPRPERDSEFGSVYRPDRIYGRSSSNNAIGVVSGNGGEYGSSRGFVSSNDAAMVAAALANDRKAFNAAARRGRIDTLYGLALPNLVIWSVRHHQLRDPQLPLPGDRGYVNEGRVKGLDRFGNEGKWTAPADYPYLDELGAEAGKTYAHGRDQAHLFNHGYAYWLATGDPRAALLQQAITAYAMAANYQRSPGVYRPRFSYQRTTLNQFSALWKQRDVTRHVTTTKSMMFWPRSRTDKLEADVWQGWKTAMARLARSQRAQDRSVAIFGGIDANEDNAYSNFMIQAYGPEAAYLWASAGEPALLRQIAENLTLRFGRIGGTRGFYGAGKGSGFPILEKGIMPYRDRDSFIAWVNARSEHPVDSFDGAPVHYVLRGYWSLRLAVDAVRRGWMSPVAGLDDAVRRTEAARDRTRSWKHAGIVSWKHAAVPLP